MPPQQTQSRNGYGTSVIVVLLIIVGLGGWFTYYTLHTQPIVDSTLREQFVWHTVPAQPLAATPGPRTTLTLSVAGTDLPAGTYPGNCSVIDGTLVKLLEGELSGVVCRLNTGGTEVGIFKEGETLVLKRGTIVGATARGSDFTPILKEDTK